MAPRKPADAPHGLVVARRAYKTLSSVTIDLQGLVREWLAQLKPNTRRAYDRALLDFAAYMEVSTHQEAAAKLFSMKQGEANAAVFQYRSELSRRGLKPSSVNLKLAAISAMNKLGRMAGLVPWSLDVPLLKTQTYRDTAGVGAEAVEPVLTRLENTPGIAAARDLAVLTLIYRQGFRRGEVASLDVHHVDFKKGKLVILGKGLTDRIRVTMTARTRRALQSWLSLRPKEGEALFPSLGRGHRGKRLAESSIWRIVHSYNLGHPHGVRHTAISEVLVRTNGSIMAAREFARHSDPKVTMRYWDKIKDLGGEAASLLDEDRTPPKEEP